MNIKFGRKRAEILGIDAYVFLSYEEKKHRDKLFKQLNRLLNLEISRASIKDFEGKESQVKLIYVKNKRIILSGVGLSKDLTLEKIRKACAKGIKVAESCKVKKAAVEIFWENISKYSLENTARAQSESSVLALYNYSKYKTEDNKEDPKITNIVFFSQDKLQSEQEKEINNGIKTGKIIAESTNLARDLGNEPPSVAHPDFVAKSVAEIGEESNFSVKILRERDIEKLKMGGVLAVARGSVHEPRFLILKYNGGSKSDKPIVLIGKGVTFDSGGINLKPAAGMEKMKMDMCGAAAVIGVFNAVSKLNLKVNLVGLTPLVENMPSGDAIKPGDIIKSYNGLTIEIGNTDAEGRLILADALSYASKFKPKYVIDIATLTGATIIALGHLAIATVGNNSELASKVIEAGNEVFERVWELPLWDEYLKLMDSDTADINNAGPTKQAGTILGGAFLKRFIGDYSWSHLDIAGTAINNSPSEYIPKHATGVGVRLITQLILNEIKK